MKKSLIKLAVFFLLIWGILFVVDYFDVHVQVPEKKDPQQDLQQSKSGPGVVVSDKKKSFHSDEFEGTADEIIEYVNQAREDEGLQVVTRNEQLMESALLKAEDMREKVYFDHVNPDGLDMSYFVGATGYKYSTIGENLAEGYFSAWGVHDAWMKSEGHRENVLGEDFEEIGVAIVEIERSGQKSYVIVEHFGTQMKKQDIATTLEATTVCDKKVKRSCENAEENKEEVKDAIEKQEDIIDDAKDDGFSDKELQALYENLEELRDLKRELKDYIKDCDEYMSECDEWK